MTSYLSADPKVVSTRMVQIASRDNLSHAQVAQQIGWSDSELASMLVSPNKKNLWHAAAWCDCKDRKFVKHISSICTERGIHSEAQVTEYATGLTKQDIVNWSNHMMDVEERDHVDRAFILWLSPRNKVSSSSSPISDIEVEDDDECEYNKIDYEKLPWSVAPPGVDPSNLQLILKTTTSFDSYYLRVYLRNTSLPTDAQDVHIATIEIQLETQESTPERMYMYLASFYNGLVNNLHFESEHGEFLEYVAKQSWTPKQFLLPVLRAFVDEHVVKGGYLYSSCEMSLAAHASTHPKHLKRKLPLIDYYQKLGFQPSVGRVTRAKTSKTLCMTCPSIEHFLKQTRPLVGGWQAPNFAKLASWLKGPNKFDAFEQMLVPTTAVDD